MAVIRSIIEDSTHQYDIDPGSGREGHLVYLVSSNKVALAQASAESTSDVIGAIKQDFGTYVLIDFSGDVLLAPQSGISFVSGEEVFLSLTEFGKVTNVPPSVTGVILNLGSAVRVVGPKVQVSLSIGTPVTL